MDRPVWKKTNYIERTHISIDKHRNTSHTHTHTHFYSHHRHITQADWSPQWTNTLKSLPSGQIITEELRCTPLLLWASRLGYRARRRNKHTRPNFLFVELWSQTHQHIQSRKVFYNACSVAMLSARMLMLCSSAQWSASTWSVWRTREILFIWWARRFPIKLGRYRKSSYQSRQLFQCHVTLVHEASVSDSSTLPMPIAVASSSK